MNPPRPTSVKNHSLQWLTEEASPIGVPLARVITQVQHGSPITLGLAHLAPGQTSRWWSFEETNQHRPDEAFLGARDETYYVVRGTLRLTWNEGVLEIGPGDAVHLPSGWHYRLENIGESDALIVYNLYPALV